MLKLMLFALGVGAPGDTGYAQGVEYRIEATLDERSEVLRGRAQLRYTNRAPAPLDTLYFHQHLNAFRPNSAWARRELEYGIERFQRLGPQEHGFERLRSARVNGRVVRAAYPFAPDSTVLALPLPEPLRTGRAATVALEWDARPATIPRRQGRMGRHYDFAHWYPRIAVHEDGAWQVQPLLPQGEFYGEFASYDVTLDVAADQVLAATGVPVAGDPGWAGVARAGAAPPRYARDAYPPRDARSLGLLPSRPAAGRKHVRWRAERVHHFAWNADPRFVYEGGEWRGIPLHALFLPFDTAWPDGRAIRRMRESLDWLDGVFGRYPYPQLTASRRIESRGATEFPMLMMNSSGSRGQVMHETVHQFAHAVLANNEWRDAWLDEGLTDFLTLWWWEEQGLAQWRPVIDSIQHRQAVGAVQPVAIAAREFGDPRIYSLMSYDKAALVFRMLREYLGADVMRGVLRHYYEQNAFTHVDEADFRRSAEAVSGQELDWFFDQWLHGNAQLDYALGEVGWGIRPEGGYRLRIEVVRNGEAWMPVLLRAGSVERLLDSRERRQIVALDVPELPDAVVLDPERVLIDVDPRNNRRAPAR